MARRATVASKVKISRKEGIVLKNSSNLLVKDIKPKDTDIIYFGPEPNFSDKQPVSKDRGLVLGHAYNWYNRFCGTTEAKEFLCRYLTDMKRTDELSKARKIPDKRMAFVGFTLGWHSRMMTRGLILMPDEMERFEDKLKNFIIPVVEESSEDDATDEKSVKPKNRVNIQEIMRDRAEEVFGQVEEMIDKYMVEGFKKEPFTTTEIIQQLMTEAKLLPQHVPLYAKRLTSLRDEFTETKSPNADKDLLEGYKSLSRTQVNNMIKFLDQVISDLNSYIAIKQATRAVRPKKPVSVDKIVSKMKYLKTFTDESAKINITSIAPAKLHNCTEAYLYDTTKRKLIYLVADDYSKCLSVKGTTIVGFDTKKSQVKTLRKPLEQLPAFLKTGKPAGRKMFTEIKTVATIPNGRTNDTILILKVW